jgi:hypothetical protein
MMCLRIYATPDGESHFDEIDIPTTERPVFPQHSAIRAFRPFPASHIRFTRIPAAMHEVSYHTVPERVLTVRLAFRRRADGYSDSSAKRSRSAILVNRSPPCRDVQMAILSQCLR